MNSPEDGCQSTKTIARLTFTGLLIVFSANSFANEVPESSNAQFEKTRNSCLAGKKNACDKLPNKQLDTANLGSYDGTRRDVVYAGASLRVVQKVPGGYIFTAKPMEFRGPGSAFIKTNLSLNSEEYYIACFFYIGDYKYTGLDGFEHVISSYRIYNGDDIPQCDQPGRLFEK